MSASLSRRIRRLPLQPANRDADRIDLLIAEQTLRRTWKERRVRRSSKKEVRRG